MIYILAPIHNRKATTLKFLRSFSNQTYKDFKMVVVDDGSTDGSSEAILSEFPKTIILKGDGNLWWTGSMNLGVEYILSNSKCTDYILAINDDVVVKNDYIDKILSASKKNGDAIVGSLYRDNENDEIIYDSGVRIDWEHYVYFQVPYDENKSVVGDVDVLATRGVLIPIVAMKKIGMFEKKLKHYAADYEYFLRAKKMGFQLLISYRAIVYGSEKDKGQETSSRIFSPGHVWNRTFGIKSPMNIFNHLFLIWNYCPSWKYALKDSCLMVGYSVYLFFGSIAIFPIKWFTTWIIRLLSRGRRA